MKRELLILSAAMAGLALIGAGCGGGKDVKSSSAANSPAVPFDRAFIDGMVPHHQQAIEMAKDAKAAGLSAPVLLGIANSIIISQQDEIGEMKQWRKKWFGSAATDPAGADALGLTMEQMGMHAKRMDFSSEKNVDSAFATMMIAHHQGAIEMATLARKKGQHDEIKTLAYDILSAQQIEIGAMKRFLGGHDMSDMGGG